MGLLNYTTKVDPDKTAADIALCLTSHGASAVMTEYDKDRGLVSALAFRITVNEQSMSFRLPCDWKPVYAIITTLDQLHALGLHGMAKAFDEITAAGEADRLGPLEWLGLLLDREASWRQDKRLGSAAAGRQTAPAGLRRGHRLSRAARPRSDGSTPRPGPGRAWKKILTPAAKREAVAHLVTTYEMSERRACRTLQADRKTVRYRSRRRAGRGLRGRLRELAGEQRRFGYRRLHVLLRAEGQS